MEDNNLKLFCDRCGTLIKIEAEGVIHCPLCLKEFDSSLFTHFERSVSLNQTEEEPELKKEVGERPLISELCPKCGHGELYFSTAQIRSADEGQTIFYECPKCGYRFSQNS